MADILLLEPKYSNKYPPIGLMKISYFHKYIQHDYVRFAKGKLPEAFKDKKWDRVYVATLFTFEWEKTKETIEYALSVVRDKNNVYTGGILATLMPDLIKTTFPTVHNCEGLLDAPGKLGFENDEIIDVLTLDYGILDDISDEYIYPAHDAYFTYMTRGCGMKCQFCAVQTLEPTYYPYVSIKDSIKKIDEMFGPKKDLLLMDNNVLRSPRFDDIIDEIKELGFYKDATYINPKSGHKVRRYVDFNQGLDAYLMTEHKARRLGELAIRPARIAFDHIEDTEAYKTAITRCAKSGITHMSNYLLYNSEDFSGKGHKYCADGPEELYDRMKLSMELQESLSTELGHRVHIFSFPMRYIPLNSTQRGYVGSGWNNKYLRSLQRMLIPTSGKGVSSRSFFEACFGKTKEDFVRFLAMPEEHLGWRGILKERTGETNEEYIKREQESIENHSFIEEWNRLFCQLKEKKEKLIQIISKNRICSELYFDTKEPELKKILLHYFTKPSFLKLFNDANEEEQIFINDYICEEFPLMYNRLIQYIVNCNLTFGALKGVYKFYDKKLVRDLFNFLNYDSKEAPAIIKILDRVQESTKIHTYSYELVNCYYLFNSIDFLSNSEKENIIESIKNFDERKTRELLLSHFDEFKKVVLRNMANGQPGEEFIIKQIEKQLFSIYEQISFFDN